MRLFFQVLFIAAHASVLVLFAAALLGRYVSPHVAWWLQPIAIALPVILLAVVIVTPIAAGMRMWTLVIASAILLVVYGLRYVDAADGGDHIDGDALTVVTMNSGGGDDNLKGGDRGLPPLLTTLQPDVMCLQEFSVGYRGNPPTARTGAYVSSFLDSLGYVVVAPPLDREHRRPPPIFSRLESEDASVIGLSSRRERDPAGTVVRAQFAWQDRSFVVYNVHLQSFTPARPWVQGNTFSPAAWVEFLRRTGAAFLQRADEAIEIRRLLDREELPFLLCGDFNTTPHEWSYWTLATGLQDAYRTSGGIWGPTFPAGKPLFRIDYIIASPHWKIGNVRVGPQLPPDHRPVIGSLSLVD